MSTNSLASSGSDGSSTVRGLSKSKNPSASATSKEMLHFDKCPRCKIQFDFIKRINVSSKVPLILNCKHTVCEDCIRRLCLANSTVCPVCQEKFTVLRTQLDSLTDLFVPHFAVIGHLVWAKNSQNRRNTGLVSTGLTLKNRHSGGSDFQELSAELDGKAEYDSDENGSDKVSFSFIFDKCPKHADQFANIHCDDCNNTYCCYCFIDDHRDHKVASLYKLSDQEMAQLDKFKTDIEVILGQLLMSRRKVKELKTFDSTNVDLNIKSYFTELHAKLHLAERNIRKRLVTIESEEADVDVVNETLKSGIYRVTQILNNFNLLNTTQLNVRALFEEVQEIRNIPCRLVSDQGALQPVEFVWDDVFDSIEDNIYLRTLPPMEYTLLPIEDWSHAQEKYELDQIRQQNEVVEEKSEADRSSRSTETEQKKTTEAKIRVVVTHLNNLNSFFIQKYSSLENLTEMNYNIGKKNRKKHLEELKIGGVFGVSYEQKNSNQWRRGKLIEIVNRGDTNRQYRMYFIDYGNTQYVTRDKIKELDFRTMKRISFAFECKLTNPDKVDFDTNAHLRLSQIIGEKELYLRSLNKLTSRDCVHEVDLFVTTSNGGFISVRNFLSKTSIPVPEATEMPLPLLDVASYEIYKNMALTTELKLFKNSKVFTIGQEEHVVVTYVKDPFYICVQLAQNVEIIQKMKKDMELHYPNQPVISCIPMEGTDVVVRYEDEAQGNWHRAKIMLVNIAEKEVEVYFVDWGRIAVLPWSRLKQLTESFIKIECQGIIIKLAHVQRFDMNEPWPQEAVSFLREQIGSDEKNRMVVSNVEPLEVALFQARPSADICLNSLLVEKNLGFSTGSISQTVYWPNMMNADVEDDDFAFKMLKKSEAVIMENDDDINLKTGLKMQVSVINFESPDLIYLKLTKHQELEDEMHKELQIHYSANARRTKNSWKSGEYCVVFDSVRNNYFRAVIKSPCGNDNYLVYLFDHVRELRVHKKKIFLQEPYFKNARCYVFKCRLANIKPAGDAGKWSHSAIEMLQKIFATYKTVHIKKVDINRSGKIFGVIMWYCFTTTAKALEPSQVKYISIQQSLIESGVAFGTPTTNKSSPASKVEIEEEDETLVEECDSEDDKDIPRNSNGHTENKDWYEMVVEDEQLITTQDGWKKMCKIPREEFDAVLTCVDSEGFFSVRDEEMQSVYVDLEERVTSKLNSMHITPDNTSWRPKDMCMIAYEDRWYRGTVLDILNNEEMSVEMIDFGSEHVVPKEQLSKFFMFPDLPPLLYKIRLYDVYSKAGPWTAKDVSELLEIVTDNIKVVIKGDLHVDVPYAEVYLDNGLSVNDLVTQKCPHMTRRENKVVLGVLDLSDNYTYAPLPPASDDNRKMFVVNVLKWDQSYNVVLSTSETHTTSEDFVSLSGEIQKQIDKQVNLQNVAIDEPCVCFHSQQKLWSRAVVYNIDSLKFGFVLAFFVDYGTVEMIPVAGLKAMRSEWFNLPVYMHIAAINIELVENNQAEYVLLRLNNLRGKYVSVEVVSEDPFTVHLYDGDDLFYQNLINSGIVKAL